MSCFSCNREVARDAHPTIVGRESFDSIQKIREKNRKIWKDKQGETGYENILEGILVCGICHHVLRRNKDMMSGKAQYYYYCGSTYNYSQVKCDTSSIADYKIFDTVFQQIKLQIDLAVEAKAVIEPNLPELLYIGLKLIPKIPYKISVLPCFSLQTYV